MRRLVLDTSVLVSGLRSRSGASYQILLRVAAGDIEPCASTALFLEYEDVLNRSDTLVATGFSAADIEAFLSAFASAARPVDIHFRWRPQLSDPKDELVLEAAVNAGRVPLVTHNVRDFVVAAPRFDVRVYTPGQYLQEVLS